jgi:hypothetical protein
MKQKDRDAIARLYLEQIDNSENFDWENPYKDDVDNIRTHDHDNTDNVLPSDELGYIDELDNLMKRVGTNISAHQKRGIPYSPRTDGDLRQLYKFARENDLYNYRPFKEFRYWIERELTSEY